jgi:hypothetical protein
MMKVKMLFFVDIIVKMDVWQIIGIYMNFLKDSFAADDIFI